MPILSLDLAVELCEAGFPQEIEKAEYFQDLDGSIFVRFPYLPFPRVGIYRSPGLGALVEACGEELKSLERCNEGWRANDVTGDTPEEAVARLWLHACARISRCKPTR